MSRHAPNSRFFMSYVLKNKLFVVNCGELWCKILNFGRCKHIKYVRMRFIGNIEAKTDAKGRAFLPAVFRKEMQSSSVESLIMRKDVFQPCLVLYPEPVWNEQMTLLRRRLNRWDSNHQLIFRQFVSDAEAVTLDANGRFLIPKRYMKMAGIEQGIKFIGMDDTIEIWSAGNTEKPFMQPDDFGRSLEEIMRGDEGRTAL